MHPDVVDYFGKHISLFLLSSVWFGRCVILVLEFVVLVYYCRYKGIALPRCLASDDWPCNRPLHNVFKVGLHILTINFVVNY